jgi:glycosyltransferase involved in cell wall biosynthesis
LISILLPVYNALPYLEACLNSILAQTETDWELLAVDDFSTDGSREVLAAHAKKEERIQVFSNPTKGIIPALRLAFAKSRGNYITRMDADDLMATPKLSRMREALTNKGEGHLVTTFVEYFSENGIGNGYRSYADWLNTLSAASSNFKEIYKECVIPSPSWMLYREDLVRCGAFQADRYPEDYDLCFRCYKNKLKVVGIPEVLHFWRDHPTRSSRTSPDYADNRFLRLKVDYFCELDYRANRNLVLWGASKKGNKIARLLVEKNISFRWLCNRPSQWGHRASGVLREDQEQLKTIPTPQVIVAIAAPNDQQIIREQLKQLRIKEEHIFFFC